MGWASGSELAEDIWKTVRPLLLLKDRQRVARELMQLFEANDCDTLDEAETLSKDADQVSIEDILLRHHISPEFYMDFHIFADGVKDTHNPAFKTRLETCDNYKAAALEIHQRER